LVGDHGIVTAPLSGLDGVPGIKRLILGAAVLAGAAAPATALATTAPTKSSRRARS
jgi:hypothetical protein